MAKKVTLISAEKLKEAFGDWIIDARYEHDIIATIDDQPEVKAIPTEWLEKEADKLIDTEYWYKDGYFLKAIIEKWEKENETNRCRQD